MMIEKMLPELMGLSVAIFALVAWMKQMGLTGKRLTAAAFVAGLVLGVAYQYAQTPLTEFSAWFTAVIFGLLCGLLATGAYKGLESATGTTLQKQQAPMIEAAYKDYLPEPTNKPGERQ